MDAYDLYKEAIQKCFLSGGVDRLSEGDLLEVANRFSEEIDRLTEDIKRGLLRDRHILVVGGAGYIGSVLVRELLARGYRVRVLDNLLYNNGSSIADLIENPAFSFIRGDFCDSRVLEQSLESVTDVVLLAALVGDPICRKYPDLAKKINEDGSINLFNKLDDHPIHKFLFASTCSNYGLKSDDEYATEEAELNPQSLYAETKVNVENHILKHKDHVKFCSTILRFSTAYGLSMRMRFDLTISEFVRELALRKNLLVYDENTWRPYCHVADMSQVIVKVIESPCEKVSGEIFNVGTADENYTKKMIAEIALGFCKEGNVHYKKGGFDPRNYRVSFDKICRELNFKNRWTIKRSISTLTEALRNGLFNDVESRKTFYGNYSISGFD